MINVKKYLAAMFAAVLLIVFTATSAHAEKATPAQLAAIMALKNKGCNAGGTYVCRSYDNEIPCGEILSKNRLKMDEFKEMNPKVVPSDATAESQCPAKTLLAVGKIRSLEFVESADQLAPPLPTPSKPQATPPSQKAEATKPQATEVSKKEPAKSWWEFWK